MPGESSLAKKDPRRWLDVAFFEKALRHGTNDRSLAVEDFFISVQRNAAEQFASSIYRANVRYRSKGKVEPAALAVKLVSSKVNRSSDELSYENESHKYRDVVNQMQDLLKQAGESNYQLTPKFLYACADPRPVIVLEDATAKGFEVHKTQLDSEGSKVVLAKLAKFHAASHALLKDVTNKNLIENSTGLFNAKSSEGVQFIKENFSIFTEELAKWSGFEKYSAKLHNVLPNFHQLSEKIFSQNSETACFAVLNHGDLNYNNILKKYNDTKTSVLDVLFIDFQLSFWGTPAVDLFYFLYLVCDKQNRESNKESLIQYYHQQLTETFNKIGYLGKIPSLQEINNDLLKYGFLEVVIAVCFVPFLFADYSTALSTFQDSQDAKEYRRQLYNSPQYRKIIEPLLPYFLHKGFMQ
ncbi:uncharacterized protein LOC129729655 [Wyeomyia smithii]|uniref:uncharacterized protein LOC129729655 n=1 Tax=Wyeomyia smithii TaxID=174621 RepID=UPI002467C361|nr:uncharacterized protein LOC129729655 [Wyeomyia smithii]